MSQKKSFREGTLKKGGLNPPPPQDWRPSPPQSFARTKWTPEERRVAFDGNDVLVALQCAVDTYPGGPPRHILEKAVVEITRLRAEVERLNWQSMESAPRDGTVVILHFDWEPLTVVGFWSSEKADWCVKWDEDTLSGGFDAPTQWMHIPVARDALAPPSK